MTIRDSAEDSAAASGDVLELCKMVNETAECLRCSCCFALLGSNSGACASRSVRSSGRISTSRRMSSVAFRCGVPRWYQRTLSSFFRNYGFWCAKERGGALQSEKDLKISNSFLGVAKDIYLPSCHFVHEWTWAAPTNAFLTILSRHHRGTVLPPHAHDRCFLEDSLQVSDRRSEEHGRPVLLLTSRSKWVACLLSSFGRNGL